MALNGDPVSSAGAESVPSSDQAIIMGIVVFESWKPGSSFRVNARVNHGGINEPMSISMISGRVVLPATAGLLALALAWHWVQGHAVGTKSGSTRTVASGRREHRPRLGKTSTGRVRAEGRVSAYPGAEVTVGTEVLGTIGACRRGRTRS